MLASPTSVSSSNRGKFVDHDETRERDLGLIHHDDSACNVFEVTFALAAESDDVSRHDSLKRIQRIDIVDRSRRAPDQFDRDSSDAPL